ncbi:hypothetical protein ACN9M1_25315 [Ralstonia sp. R-29]|uniref:hypothetical protein n=1 Tax=Ralstonia sp. R-29 TaxID=3404059 RepID=UPI003CF3868F
MLSPHEIATLLLVRGGSRPLDLDDVDVQALLSHQLIALEPTDAGPGQPRVTLHGQALLQALGVVRPAAV